MTLVHTDQRQLNTAAVACRVRHRVPKSKMRYNLRFRWMPQFGEKDVN